MLCVKLGSNYKLLGLYSFKLPFISKTQRTSAFTDVHIQMIKESELPSPTESQRFLSDSDSTKKNKLIFFSAQSN